jgi:hypothetical protein
MMHRYLHAEIDEVDYITSGVEYSPIITALVESKDRRCSILSF